MINLIVVDTETCRSAPHTLQLYDGKTLSFTYVSKRSILDKFLEYLKPRIRSKGVNVIFAHNLGYDLVVLLCQYYELFIHDDFELTHKGVKFEVAMRKGRFYVNLFYRKTRIQFLDSFYFYPYSLEYLAETLRLSHKKNPKPKYLGLKPLRTPEFVEYAKQDVRVQYDLAQHILSMHSEFDIPLSVSSAQFSQYVFQKHFLMSPIKLPPKQVLTYSLLSYHGGKNAYYSDRPQLFKRVYELDIISAYPYVMSLLPSFYKGSFYYVDGFVKNRLGVYYVEGTLKDSKYRVIPDKEFKYPSGKYRGWVTGFELQEALTNRLLKIKRMNGYIYEPSKIDQRPSPFAQFVKHFYGLKESCSKSDPQYLFNKLILNSLYGKFIQKSDRLDNISFLDSNGSPIELSQYISPGGLFNPFIATQITGCIRAMLYRLEKKYHAIHSSTDSIKTLHRPKEQAGLGGLKIECFGDCLILRPKLYLHYDQDGQLSKYALHGFQGTPEQLEKMWEKKVFVYSKNRLVKVRESLRRHKKIPLTMERKKYILNVDSKS